MPWIYPPFTSLEHHEQQAVISNYEQKFRDFDNDIIINSALEVLHANGRTNVNAIQVGPDRAGEDFDLFAQLIGKIPEDKRYTIFSLPTWQGRHSVAVVIDTQNSECHVIDSLNRVYPEAIGQIQTAIEIGILEGYSIVRPSSSVTQQSDTWSCGIHSAANIVGIITGDIDLKTNKGISPRSDADVRNLLGIFSKAYAEISVQREHNLNDPRLNARHKKALRSALEAIDSSNFGPKVQSDIQTLIEAVLIDLPKGVTDDQLMQQRPFTVFLTEFSERNPGNALVPVLNSADFASYLPASLQGNYEDNALLIQLYIAEQLMAQQASAALLPTEATLPSIDRSVASSSTPVVAEEFSLEIALKSFVEPILDRKRQKDLEHAIMYFGYMTRYSPDMFNETSCRMLASHKNSINLACALIELGSVTDPIVQVIVSLDDPRDYRHRPAVGADAKLPTHSSASSISSSSSQPSASPAPQLPQSESSSSSSADKGLSTEFIQFLSSIPKHERGGLQVRDYWNSRTPEVQVALTSRFNAENQPKATSRSTGGALDYIGSFFGQPPRSETSSGMTQLDEFLDKKAKDLGFDNIEGVRYFYGDEMVSDISNGFFSPLTQQFSISNR
ncbi:hypothetical protein [Legionella quateirensis]|uniref:Uncharacterized protein n=1 Tax=Legionella quateirensis TaxID=45072 RepID=A0A378KXR8_9GAMM|nr:hypothetical protein [Legionella quateirensis]KTD46272.1 hypothetical protein Lqua_2375 [Legionella quateirensis]STY18959.1 Uncharacterised protein [Legionella quateirensis]